MFIHDSKLSYAPFNNLSFTDQDQSGSQLLPLPLTDLFSEEYQSNSYLSQKSIQVFRSLSLSQEDCDNIEKHTKLQRECSDWHRQRQGRLTTSCFHDVLVLKKHTNCESLVQRILTKIDLYKSYSSYIMGKLIMKKMEEQSMYSQMRDVQYMNSLYALLQAWW